MKYASIGSISEGTLRDEDLLGCFASELDDLLRKQPRGFPRKAHRKLINDAERMLKRVCDFDEDLPDDASELVAELSDALNEYSPPYCHFGANEGDGACFGWWLNSEVATDFDGLKVDDLSEVPTGYRGEVLLVNDHGNMTLLVAYAKGKTKEVWAVV